MTSASPQGPGSRTVAVPVALMPKSESSLPVTVYVPLCGNVWVAGGGDRVGRRAGRPDCHLDVVYRGSVAPVDRPPRGVAVDVRDADRQELTAEGRSGDGRDVVDAGRAVEREVEGRAGGARRASRREDAQDPECRR